MSEKEKELFLQALAKAKDGRYGKVIFSVADGRVVDIEFQQKLDKAEINKVYAH